jgi:hypothetical protein
MRLPARLAITALVPLAIVTLADNLVLPGVPIDQRIEQDEVYSR